MAQFRAALSPRVALVSVMWANNETGVLFPIAEMAELAHEQGALFHCDAVQVVGKMPIAVGETRIDMLSCSAHKFHGPKGVGCLYLRRERSPAAARRSSGVRSGARTENICGIVGMGAACELANIHLPGMAHIGQLRDRLEHRLLACVPSVMVMGGSQPLKRRTKTKVTQTLDKVTVGR